VPNNSYCHSIKKLNYFTVFVFAVFIAYSCSKEGSIRRNSKYFSAEIDGIYFAPCKDKFMGLPPLEVEYKTSEKVLNISANNTCDSPITSIRIQLFDIEYPGIYELNIINKSAIQYSQNSYETDSIRTGYIEITKLDLKEKKLSATFEINAISRDSLTINVLNGLIENLAIYIDNN